MHPECMLVIHTYVDLLKYRKKDLPESQRLMRALRIIKCILISGDRLQLSYI